MTDRLFVAVWPDGAVRAALSGAIESARQQHPEVRWQAPERWHLTVAFLGPADAVQAAERLAALGVSGLPLPEPIRLRGAGTFGPVVWVGVEHGPWLAEFARAAQHRLKAADHRFRAHVTVGRTRGPDAHRIAQASVASLASHTGPQWRPSSVTLVRSVTGPHPEYHVIGRWPFPQ